MTHSPEIVEAVARALRDAEGHVTFEQAATAALDAIEAAGFDVTQRPKQEPLSGCHVDIFDTITGMPDGCVFDDGAPNDCIYTTGINCREMCPHWKVITQQSVEEAGGTWRPELLAARPGAQP